MTVGIWYVKSALLLSQEEGKEVNNEFFQSIAADVIALYTRTNSSLPVALPHAVATRIEREWKNVTNFRRTPNFKGQRAAFD